MKTATTLAIICIVIFACHRKTVAASDDIIISNKIKSETKAPTNTETISAGQTVYSSRCGRCHYLKTPQDYTSQQWDNILKTMIPKAKLNNEEAMQVTAYVMEHAKK